MDDVGDDIRGEVREELAEASEVVEVRAGRVAEKYPRGAARLRIVRAVLREQTQEQVGLAASGAAFWLIISAFPIAIAAVSLFGLVLSPEQVAKDLSGLAAAGPASLGAIVTDQLRRIAASDHVGLSVGLAVSLVLALWSASAGVYNLDRAIRTAYGLRPDRYLEARGRAFLGAFVVVLAVGISAVVSAALGVVVDYVPAFVVAIVSVPIALAVGTAVIMGLYRFSVGRHMKTGVVLPGAVGASAGVLVVVVAFTWSLHFSTHYTAVYGALAGAVIAMVGTYLAVYVILLGAVLNVEISGQRNAS